MAEERNAENFALGLIVAAIAFMLLRREFGKGKTTAYDSSVEHPGVSAPACGCGAAQVQDSPQNPGISLGGQSYNAGPGVFGPSSVTPAMKGSPNPGKQWVTHA